MKRHVPRFRSKEEAALFWENHEILDYLSPDEFRVVDPRKEHRYNFANPRRKSLKQLISLRVETHLLKKAKTVASRKGVGYQSI